ncbi:MAG: YggT family protein [Acidimicrobiales bacterium]
MGLVKDLISLYIWVLIISALLSWFPTTTPDGALAAIKRVLARLTEPVLRPLRAILPRLHAGGAYVDFSVLVAVVILIIIERVI